MTANDRLEAIAEHVKALSDENHPLVGHFGAIKVGETSSTWWSIRIGNAALKCLDNPDYKVAQVLATLGNEHRLAILRSTLYGPKTVAEILAETGLSTTGQVHHHLRELERSRYVERRDGGRYHFLGDRGRLYLSILNLAADGGVEDGGDGMSD